jgi:hypothetical protein
MRDVSPNIIIDRFTLMLFCPNDVREKTIKSEPITNFENVIILFFCNGRKRLLTKIDNYF